MYINKMYKKQSTRQVNATYTTQIYTQNALKSDVNGTRSKDGRAHPVTCMVPPSRSPDACELCSVDVSSRERGRH
jgi:hypothetical protein